MQSTPTTALFDFPSVAPRGSALEAELVNSSRECVIAGHRPYDAEIDGHWLSFWNDADERLVRVCEPCTGRTAYYKFKGRGYGYLPKVVTGWVKAL